MASSTSASSRNASNSYSSSLDLINFDPIAPITTNNVSSSAVAEGGSIFASVFESNFTSSSRKEGKQERHEALMGSKARQVKPTAYSLKQKRTAFSSRYAFSLVDLFTSSTQSNSRPLATAVSLKTPTTSPCSDVSSLPPKSVTINPNVLFGMVLSFHLFSLLLLNSSVTITKTLSF